MTKAFAAATEVKNRCLADPSTCDQAKLAGSFTGPALAEVTSMVKGLARTRARIAIGKGDGYDLEYAAVNESRSRASVSGCFRNVRDTFDADDNILLSSSEATREAFELTAIDGTWVVATHRALGSC